MKLPAAEKQEQASFNLQSYNIPLCVPEIRGNEWKYIKECLDTNWVSSAGKYVDLFEERFAAFVGSRYAVSTVNGTASLHLALVVLGIGTGDEVIVPTLTFIAPVNAIAYTGARPVFVDSESRTFNIDPEKIEEKITSRTRAILPVHLFGHPANLGPILEIAKKYNLYVIEDATESLGAKYQGRHTGTLGDIGCFSFNGNKLITTGGGGMLVTDDDEIARKAKLFSTQAKLPGKAFFHPYIGYNYRLTNIQAALGVAQLEKVEEYVRIKRRNAFYYNQLLKNIPGLVLPCQEDWAFSSFWLYSLLIDNEGGGYPYTRDKVIKMLEDYGIESRPFFMPVHTLPPYENLAGGRKREFPVAMKLSETGLNLPSSVGLKAKEIEVIVGLLDSNRT